MLDTLQAVMGCIIVKVTVYKVDPDKSLTDVLVADGSGPNDKIAPSYFSHFISCVSHFYGQHLNVSFHFFSVRRYKPLISIDSNYCAIDKHKTQFPKVNVSGIFTYTKYIKTNFF